MLYVHAYEIEQTNTEDVIVNGKVDQNRQLTYITVA